MVPAIVTLPDVVSQPRHCARSPGILVGCVSGCRVPVGCKQWTCGYCGKGLRWRFLARVRGVSYSTFCTFTTTVGEVTRETAMQLTASIRRWRRLARSNGVAIDGCSWVLERGPRYSRRLHKHMVFTGSKKRVDYRLLQRLWVEANRGFSWCHFSRVRTSAAGYLAKYLVKQAEALPRYVRRVYSSAPGLPKLPQFEPMTFVPVLGYQGPSYDRAVCTRGDGSRAGCTDRDGEGAGAYPGPSSSSWLPPILDPVGETEQEGLR